MKKFLIGIIILIVLVIIVFMIVKETSSTPPSSTSSTSSSAQNTSTVSDANEKQSEAFLAKNKTKPGVIVLPSHLQYKVLEAGTGNKLEKNTKVVLTFEGRKLNDQVFQSEKGRELPVTAVIPGMQEALRLMPVGSTWLIFVPASLGYGQQGKGNVGPNEVLIIKVHLIAVKP
ncbi:MAG TPA: FKBP-type peptidyl-prolyl cis-trans isomerase [Gammaproteobacteria bacterium]|nr:FKBP-type peptidyl-prolyl cis-trans isomerase [Gammaproteobacteria bacterium]